MKIKMLIHHVYTKRCPYGNVYHAVKITNPATGKNFTVNTPSLENVEHILYDAFGDYPRAYKTEECTNSTRLSSLPASIYLNQCQYGKDWKKTLAGIGYRKLATPEQ